MQINDFVIWIANHISDMITGHDRIRFLHDLKNSQDHVVEIISQDIEQFGVTYTKQTGIPYYLDADEGDASPAITCAKAVTSFICDELLRDELAKIK